MATHANTIPPGAEREASAIDPNSLPAADRALIAGWWADAKLHPPDIGEWATLIACLRWAAERERRGDTDPRLPEGMTSVVAGVNAFTRFLTAHDYVLATRLHVPLYRLHAAIVDVSEGKTPAIFKPTRLRGRPGKGAIEANVMAVSALALAKLVEAGDQLEQAARAVARACGAGRVKGWRNIKAATVRNWRAQLEEGEGAASWVALERFKAPLPPEAGSSARQQAEYLLAALRDSPALRHG